MSTVTCGFSQNVITPPGTGIFLDGYGHRMAPMTRVHDDLYVKTAVFSADHTEFFAIVVMDILGVNAEIYTLLTDYIYLITGLDRQHVSICGTHTHSGPAGGMIDGLPINHDYWCHTAQICADTIREAMQGACVCTCRTAISDRKLLLSVNRRGRPFIDRRIKTVVFTGTDGRMRGVIATACCHPVINTSLEMTADYPAVLTRRALEEYGVPFLFLQGSAGDINPHPDIMADPERGMELLGNELADGIFSSAAKAGRSFDIPSVRSVFCYEKIPMKPFPDPDHAEKNLRDSVDQYTKLPWSLEKHYALRQLEWHRLIRQKAASGESPDLSLPFQVFSVSEHILFVFLPFEVMTATAQKLETFFTGLGYQPENIFIISCSNSVSGYLVPVEEFAVGGYEVSGVAKWYGLPEFCENSEKAVIDVVRHLTMTLKGGCL